MKVFLIPCFENCNKIYWKVRRAHGQSLWPVLHHFEDASVNLPKKAREHPRGGQPLPETTGARSWCEGRGWAQPSAPQTQPFSQAARNHFPAFWVHCTSQDKRQRRNFVCLSNVVIYLIAGLITMLSALLIYLAFDSVDSF